MAVTGANHNIYEILTGLDMKLRYEPHTPRLKIIAISENISEHDRELLITAAYFHDTGYIREYDKNEPIAARMAGRILKLIGYKPNEIEKIQKMIDFHCSFGIRSIRFLRFQS